MKTQKLAKRTLFVFKKKYNGKINEPTSISEPTTSGVTTTSGIV